MSLEREPLRLVACEDVPPPYHKRNWLSFKSFPEELAAELKLAARIRANPLRPPWPFTPPSDCLRSAAWLQPPKPERVARKNRRRP